ncbi:MAG: T9SS type A sorting domain-containing protein [Bacteroidales bacterium]|nr:T9SS type A sorting domain-containing protein [Bacteroidales bacterium]
MVEAIKEQQKMIDELKFKMETGNFKSTSNFNYNEENQLFQNSPNPFSENTKIEYFLSENVTSASICIYNLNGEQLKSLSLYSRGKSNVEITKNELRPGIYIYSLIADGNVIDTKRMTLTN